MRPFKCESLGLGREVHPRSRFVTFNLHQHPHDHYLLIPSHHLPFRAMSEKLNLMIVAGEPSGDAHAAALVNALPSDRLNFFGGTGPRLRAAGVETIVATDELSILGLPEIGRALPNFLRAYKELKQAAFQKNADAVVLIDWPDFNLPLARALHRRGIKVIYYISPQLWAWRSHRVKQIKRDVDLMLTILPFEREWYLSHGVNHVEFVGHPLAGEVKVTCTREEFCRQQNLDPSRPIVSLLPGSRLKELQRILPPMLDAAAALLQKRPDLQFVVVVAPSRSLAEAKEIIDRATQLPSELRLVHHHTREALAASDAAAVASGTATLEAALLGTPMVIVYKESAFNWHTLGRLITAEHYGLVNLIAGRRVVTELMQDEFTAELLSDELLSLLDRNTNVAVRKELQDVAVKLGPGGASERAAAAILSFLGVSTISA
jgi:lipid-A-disaccharide synthase